MKLLILILSLNLANCSTNKNAAKVVEKNPPVKKPEINKCICVQLWMPVCGSNGKTYSNSCFAKCANVDFKPGSCESDLE